MTARVCQVSLVCVRGSMHCGMLSVLSCSFALPVCSFFKIKEMCVLSVTVSDDVLQYANIMYDGRVLTGENLRSVTEY
jgi:hypothetical protein